ncbi:MAG: hypothetical protein AAF517_23475 [Planctomycetota bacterium]
MHGGIAHNVISDDCTFVWDVRVIPQDSAQRTLERRYAGAVPRR